MKASAIVVWLVVCCAVQPSLALELKLSSPMPEQLPFVYPDVYLNVANRSAVRVVFPARGVRLEVVLERENGWVPCHGLSVHSGGLVKWEPIEAGGVRTIPVAASRCLCVGSQSMDMCEWMNEPGTYRLKAVVSTEFEEDSGPDSAPAGSFRGSLESPPFEIVVKQPTGIDAEAIAWAKGSPMTVEVLKMFPGSEYAALFWYGRVRLDTADPVTTRSLIERNLYPGPNSVPDPTSPNGWSSLDSGGVAKWQILWGERVLREHPSFVYRDYARIVVALSQMSLGMKVQAQETLDGLATNDRTAAGRWSRAFQAAGAPEKTK